MWRPHLSAKGRPAEFARSDGGAMEAVMTAVRHNAQ